MRMHPCDAGCERHVLGPMDGDPVVEVDRVPHAAQRSRALAGHEAVDVEDPAGRLGDAHRSASRPAREAARRSGRCRVVIVVAVLNGLAVGIDLAGRDVRHQAGAVGLEDHQHLLGEVDLDVVEVAELASRGDRDRILHAVPHLGRHLDRSPGCWACPGSASRTPTPTGSSSARRCRRPGRDRSRARRAGSGAARHRRRRRLRRACGRAPP